MTAGTLYIVSTPIGNLGDITYRAVDVLSNVNLIAAEDTRTSRILLNRYNIDKALTSFHSHNQVRKTPALIQKLVNREDIAVISDAGTPGISDPAYYLVKQAVKENINVVPVPGCSALLAALVVSGLSTNRFVFEGFLPVKKGRKKRLGYLSNEERTIVLYESPHRLLRTLRDLLDHLGNRKISISRELTKMYEEVLHTNIEEALSKFESRDIKGEFVLVIESKPRIN